MQIKDTTDRLLKQLRKKKKMFLEVVPLANKPAYTIPLRPLVLILHNPPAQ
jgi:hypothetical protein